MCPEHAATQEAEGRNSNKCIWLSKMKIVAELNQITVLMKISTAAHFTVGEDHSIVAITTLPTVEANSHSGLSEGQQIQCL